MQRSECQPKGRHFPVASLILDNEYLRQVLCLPALQWRSSVQTQAPRLLRPGRQSLPAPRCPILARCTSASLGHRTWAALDVGQREGRRLCSWRGRLVGAMQKPALRGARGREGGAGARRMAQPEPVTTATAGAVWSQQPCQALAPQSPGGRQRGQPGEA